MILNLTSKSLQKKPFLNRWPSVIAEIAISVKNLMFVFDDLVGVSDRDLQRILVEVEQRDLALGLKGCIRRTQGQTTWQHKPARRRSHPVEEIDLMGPVRVSDVEEAQRQNP